MRAAGLPNDASASSASADPRAARVREIRLIAWMRENGSLLLGYSGGVDSAYLAAVAHETLPAGRFLAVIGRSASYPEEQWIAAHRLARQLDFPVLELTTQELDDPRYAENPVNRCYFCKSELWGKLVPLARERGFAVVCDGTNADDLAQHRPGAAAAAELGVVSPLAVLGFTKAEIRLLSALRDLPTSAQPSSPCLSSRIPYGMSVTPQRLREIERAEAAVRALGITGDLRVRHHGKLAIVELAPDELDRWIEGGPAALVRRAILSAGFQRVALDLAGFRSGSLNVLGLTRRPSQTAAGVA